MYPLKLPWSVVGHPDCLHETLHIAICINISLIPCHKIAQTLLLDLICTVIMLVQA